MNFSSKRAQLDFVRHLEEDVSDNVRWIWNEFVGERGVDRSAMRKLDWNELLRQEKREISSGEMEWLIMCGRSVCPVLKSQKHPCKKKRKKDANKSLKNWNELISYFFPSIHSSMSHRLSYVPLQLTDASVISLHVSTFLSTFPLLTTQRWETGKGTNVISHTCSYSQCF